MKKKINLTKNFTTPEILNKYRHIDKNIDDKIKKDEKIKEIMKAQIKQLIKT